MCVHTFWKALMTFEAVCTMQIASLMSFSKKFNDHSLKLLMNMRLYNNVFCVAYTDMLLGSCDRSTSTMCGHPFQMNEMT